MPASYAERIKETRDQRAAKRRQLAGMLQRAGLPIPRNDEEAARTIAQLQQKIQMLEASHDAQRSVSTPPLLAVTSQGLVDARELSNQQELMNRARALTRSIEDGAMDLQKVLDHEETEMVEWWGDETFYGSINGVFYFVPGYKDRPKNRKALPKTLAAHFRKKTSTAQAVGIWEKEMGAMEDPRDTPGVLPMEGPQFAHQVAQYERTMSLNVDVDRRRKWY